MKQYGLTDRVAALASMAPQWIPARITLQEKGLYQLVAACGEKLAEVSGRFRYEAEVISDYPAVGDFVMADWNEGGNAVIHQVLHRKSCIVRKAAGNARQEQVVAANVDAIFLCMALNNDFNIRRLERYLSIAWDSGATPVIVLTKADLCDDLHDKRRQVEDVAIGVDILVTTAVAEDGYAQVLPYVTQGRTVAFIGSSGVGKSTLINRLLGEERLDTNGLRNDDKGRHTTTHRELLLLPDGGMVIDTPGMRELGMWDASEGLADAFADVEKYLGRCRFSDCRHESEPGCAIKAAIAAGELDPMRWESYKNLKEEALSKDELLRRKHEWSKSVAKFTRNRNKEIW